ncbi:MAG TPA: HK97 gp10 family phage protein [Candidatus Paenibacillus intestinavium]|nr:HK97 gp10 family phage protein [Candidatus Paenibacillus intestinavium]
MSKPFSIETKGLDEFQRNLDMFIKTFPNESKKLLRAMGNKAKQITARRAKSDVGKVSGNYYKSIKRGKVYVDPASGQLTIRVYTSSKIAPHAHLVENGHRTVDGDGVETGFVKGKKIFPKTRAEIEAEWYDLLDKEIYKSLQKL